MKIGILRCLLYYPFYPFWQSFFSELGFETVLSPPMTAESFDRGHRRFVGDICLPIETAFRHVEIVKDGVDLIFIPQANKLHKDVYVCPACAGLPYVISHNLPDMPDVLSVNLTPFLLPDRSDMGKFKRFGIKARKVHAAFAFARERYLAFIEGARREPHLEVAIAGATGQIPRKIPSPAKTGPRVLLLGMPYVLGDPFVNQGIPHMLAARKCSLTTPLMISPELANQEIDVEGYRLYWTFGGMSIGAMTKLVTNKAVDAVIYCSSFACGVDSLITPIVQSACRRCYKLPFLQLVLDEHAGASHVEVRIEAFLDCVGASDCEGKAAS